MNRREFVHHLALLAAGAAALPAQIAAFERYYDLNSPKTGTDLVAVDEFYIGGLAERSLPLILTVLRGGPGVPVDFKLCMPFNAFGGIIRWVAAPDQKIVVAERELLWTVESIVERSKETSDAEWLERQFSGHVSYIRQDGVRRSTPLNKLRGSLNG